MSDTPAPAPSAPSDGPLAGLRVLELGHFVAAPFCTRLLADLGADVIKVEPPGRGDPVRTWGAHLNGHSLWWSVHGRNKRCVTLDLKRPEAREIALRLTGHCDAVVENFRPGQLSRLGLGDDILRTVRPDLVIAHISGYGQDGPYRDRAAFGVVGEAIGGLRHLTDHAPGMTDLPSVRTGVSLGDSLTGLYAAFGLMAALWRRDRAKGGDGRPRTIDAALSESVFSLLEGCLPEYGALGMVRQPTGATLPTAAPTSAYRTADGRWILIAANSDPLFARLTAEMGQPELAQDPRFTGNMARVANAATLDELIGGWTKTLDAAEIEQRLNRADVPATRIYTIADIAEDPQYHHRGMIQQIADPRFGPEPGFVLHPGVLPHVPEDTGAIRWPGPAVGAHNQEVFGTLLGLSPAELARLSEQGAI
jgi:crotonobetainyl-CoA:carnitine CoA-transferase CaiB-like acyl-CoA transferase